MVENCRRGRKMQRINPQINKCGRGDKVGELLHNCSRNPAVVQMRRMSQTERVRTSER